MSIVAAVHDYVMSMLKRVSGMKVLLLDSDTIGIVSMVLSQTQILEQEVFLVEVFDRNDAKDSDKAMKHLKAVCFLRPTAANFLFLSEELKSRQRFSEYHLFFSNAIPQNRLEQLAGCDEMELVEQVQEIYSDVFAINSDLFSLNIPTLGSLMLQPSLWTSFEESILNRMVDGVFSSIIALRMFPCVRFSSGSSLCMRLAQLVQNKIDNEYTLFEQMGGVRAQSSVVLILDRREDAVTPLLNQWTYQGMCHELIGISNNRMMIGANGSKGSSSGEVNGNQEIVLSSFNDKFYEENLVSNFGDLALNIDILLKQFQAQSRANSTKNINSIEEMQSFVDQYPEFKRISGNVSKHVSVVHELSRLVTANNLISLSALEQEIACDEGLSNYQKDSMAKKVLAVLSDAKNPQMEKLRLVLLFSLKFSNDTVNINEFKKHLLSGGTSGIQFGQEIVESLKKEYIESLLSSKTSAISSTAQDSSATAQPPSTKQVLSFIRKAVGFSGVENVYTQHKSKLLSVVDNAIKGKLKDQLFPYVESKQRAGSVVLKEKPRNVIVFVIGGATYEEGRDVRILNSSVSQQELSCNVVVGGSTIHNAKSFLADVAQMRRFVRK